MTDTALFESEIPNLDLIARGKVRDIYAVDKERLLIVTTDRLSAYDVVMPDPVPGKGELLCRLSAFWFSMMADIVPNHLTGLPLTSCIDDHSLAESLEGRSIIVKRLNPLPIEAVVRGYLIGSGWRDYQASGTICGLSLPNGLVQGQRLPELLYTPATKADVGGHDENISFEQTVELIGAPLADRVRELTIAIYERAVAHALERGIIIADTKFEFGLDDEKNLYVIDEMLTPDSSRFWPLDEYRTGTSPPSYDKQFVRDYLDTLDWNHEPPGPGLPADVIAKTREKYAEALQRLTGPASRE
ncbi:MAG: phosphoribosylaminoimidazolesuccinocarboxamide synthase [Pseudomonadota bacterium]